MALQSRHAQFGPRPCVNSDLIPTAAIGLIRPAGQDDFACVSHGLRSLPWPRTGARSP
jgi:hypothetical protein